MRYLILLLILCAVPAAAVITPAGSPVSCVAASNSVSTCAASGPLTVSQGDAIVLTIHTLQATSPYTVSQAGCSLSWQPYALANRTQFFLALNAAAGSCTITVSRPTGSNDGAFAWMAQAYSGVDSRAGNYVAGTTGNGGIASSSPCQLQITTQDPNNFVVGAASWNQGTGLSLATGVSPGTSRYLQQWGGWTFRVADNTSSSAGNVNVGFTWTQTNPVAYCGMNALELRAAANITGSHIATLSDQQHTVLLTGANNITYTLPNTMISPTWCAYVMATGSATYEIAVQAPSTLNGQSQPMPLPHWQMSRVCEDSSSNYWADPPLVAGSGVSIAGSPTGITISAGAVRRARNRERNVPQARRTSRAIAGATASCVQNTNTVMTCQGSSLAVSPGDTVILAIAGIATGAAFDITDTCNHQWTNTRSAAPYLFVGTGGAGSSCQITSTRTAGGNMTYAWVAVTYSGVAAAGPPSSTGNACGAAVVGGSPVSCARGLTLQANGNTLVGVFYLNSGTNQNPQPLTVNLGTLRGGFVQSIQYTIAIIDNTPPVAGLVQVSLTFGPGVTSNASGTASWFELEAVPPPGPGTIVLTPTPTAIVVSAQ